MRNIHLPSKPTMLSVFVVLIGTSCSVPAHAQLEALEDGKNPELEAVVTDHARDAVVKMLDDFFSLDVEQRDKLLAWSKSELSNDLVLGFIDSNFGIESPSDSLKTLGLTPMLKKTLSKKQVSLLSKIESEEWFESFDADVDEEDYLQRFVATSNLLVGLRVDQIERCCNLDRKQTEKLRIAGQLATRRAKDKWNCLCDAFGDGENMEMYNFQYRPLLYISLHEPVWTGTLQQTLTPEQLELLKPMAEWRHEATETRAILFAMFTVSTSFVDNVQNYKALSELLRKTVDIRSGDYFRGMCQFLMIDKKQLKAVYKDDLASWNRILPELDDVRQQIRHLQGVEQE